VLLEVLLGAGDHAFASLLIAGVEDEDLRLGFAAGFGLGMAIGLGMAVGLSMAVGKGMAIREGVAIGYVVATGMC
jgi:uncharacterized protein YebE (UPF0316 family)